uniref:Myosin motor domain-containing protein n=1 Tax=Brugia timori TaxID=42155 RepID=A0A0R3QFZ4_9BILA
MSVMRNKDPTVASHFRKLLENLVASLEHKEPFFINCIVPNAIRRPLVNSQLILLIEEIKVNLIHSLSGQEFSNR